MRKKFVSIKIIRWYNKTKSRFDKNLNMKTTRENICRKAQKYLKDKNDDINKYT